MAPAPCTNLKDMANVTNYLPSSIAYIAPRPTVVRVTRSNPSSIVFFVPIVFLIKELKGESITYANENAARTNPIDTLVGFDVSPDFSSSLQPSKLST